MPARALSTRALRLLAAMACVVVLAACGSGGGSDAPELGTGDPATDQAGEDQSAQLLSGVAPTVDGNTLDLAAYAGEDVILWFWAPW